MKSITINFVKHEDQRYNTLGDWHYPDDPDRLVVNVSADMGFIEEIPTEEEQILVAVHEVVEALLCRSRGITAGTVDTYDHGYPYPNDSWFGEPGDGKSCPYRKEHRFAMIIEHMLAHELGLKGYGTIK